LVNRTKEKPPVESALRSDAQRNRDEILAAAVLAFAKDANASLEGIARAAGVGIGTLYRHFPTREALFEAAYRKEIKKLCEAAPGLLKKHRPDIALARFFDLFIDHMASKRGMIEAMRAAVAAGGSPLNESLAIFSSALAPLLEAGKAKGVLRDDVTVDDLLSVKGAVVTARPEAARRLAVLLIDGLRSRAREPFSPSLPPRASRASADEAGRKRPRVADESRPRAPRVRGRHNAR
jgi:AcrR family transcriptional regulator